MEPFEAVEMALDEVFDLGEAAGGEIEAGEEVRRPSRGNIVRCAWKH
ncbi:MAG: hypothetical protein R3A52_05405 [Polyangiales bacterium]